MPFPAFGCNTDTDLWAAVMRYNGRYRKPREAAFQTQAVLNPPGTSLWSELHQLDSGAAGLFLLELLGPPNPQMCRLNQRFLFVFAGVLGVQIHILQDPESFQPHQTGTFHRSGHHL